MSARAVCGHGFTILHLPAVVIISGSSGYIVLAIIDPLIVCFLVVVGAVVCALLLLLCHSVNMPSLEYIHFGKRSSHRSDKSETAPKRTSLSNFLWRNRRFASNKVPGVIHCPPPPIPLPLNNERPVVESRVERFSVSNSGSSIPIPISPKTKNRRHVLNFPKRDCTRWPPENRSRNEPRFRTSASACFFDDFCTHSIEKTTEPHVNGAASVEDETVKREGSVDASDFRANGFDSQGSVDGSDRYENIEQVREMPCVMVNLDRIRYPCSQNDTSSVERQPPLDQANGTDHFGDKSLSPNGKIESLFEDSAVESDAGGIGVVRANTGRRISKQRYRTELEVRYFSTILLFKYTVLTSDILLPYTRIGWSVNLSSRTGLMGGTSRIPPEFSVGGGE